MIHNEYVERDEQNGRFTDTISLKPIAYRVNGSLRRMTNALSLTNDPDMEIGTDELCSFRVSKKISNKPLIHFGKGQSHVKIGLVDANKVDGVVNGNAITFVNAWNNADLVYRNGGHRLQEDILLKAGHPRSFAFRLDSHAGFNSETMSFGNDFRILDPVLEKGELTVPLKWLVTQQGGKHVLTVNLPAGDWSGWVLDPTLTLQPDAAGIDTSIQSNVATRNRGANTDLLIGEDGYASAVYRTLIKFDLSELPSGANISSATLSLYALTDRATSTSTFSVYRQKRAWVEGTGVDTSPATNGATWNKYDVVNNLSWSTAGGFHADDCEQMAIGSRAMSASESVNAFLSWTLTPTTKTGLDLGNGWLIKSETEADDAYWFASSDYATAAYRPKLVVEYTLHGGGRRALLGVGQ